MARLMIHRNLLKDLGSLPAATRKKVSEMVDKFHRDSKTPALHLEPYNEAVDGKVRSARVDEAYRAIVIAPTQGDTYLLMHVDHHDKAYRWCKNKCFEIHQATGVLQVFDVEEVNAVAKETKPIFQPVSSYPLQKLSDDEIFHAGVPSPLIPAVRVIQSDEALTALKEYLPADSYQVLLFVACGMTVDEALNEALGITDDQVKKVADVGDFTNLEEQSNLDLVFVDGQEELKRIMASSFDAWRIFLHPYQRKIVEWNVTGSMKVNGAAGTGKTVVMMHRAVHLASLLTKPNSRVLVTTYTTNLSVTIKDLIQRLAAQKCPEAADKIEVTNLHALARTICTRGGWRGKVAGKQAMDEIWQDLLESSIVNAPAFTPDFIREEYEEVVDPMGITTEDEYLTSVRSGRPRLTRQQRKAVWPEFAAFQRELKKRNLLTFDGLIHEARLALDKGDFPRYEHVLVDEIQDFGVEALRLIRMLSPSTEGAMNPLTVVGDGHQRIYKSNIPLSRAGIEVRGRSRRLKINYRTTEQIRTCAQKMLEGVEVDDLDGEGATTVGDQSLVHGPPPTFHNCAGLDEEAAAVVKWVQGLLAENYATHEICIAPGKPGIRSALAADNIPTLELQANASDPESSEAGVRLGTLYRIKGLEFKAVALCLTGEISPKEGSNPLAKKRRQCLHYVAATRARERLLITS